MNYNDSVNYIHSLFKFGIRPDLFGMGALLSYLGNPEKDLKCVHIAGTNGKGSTSTAVSNIGIEAGYNVGLYTSPYVSEFLERIQFNGKPIDKTLFAESVEKVKTAVEKLSGNGIAITEFEALTATAFLSFKELGCDFVVLEVGLGGRYDATNIISTPLVNVITSLSIDHSAILGDTVEKIAMEKCGTIKENSTVITSVGQPSGALEVIKATSKDKNAFLIIPDENSIKMTKTDIFGTEFEYKNKKYFVSMMGYHQVKNMVCAIETAEILKKNFDISESDIVNGISKTVLPARVEIISKSPLVILDGGHNEDGAKAFYDAVSPILKTKRKVITIAGMMADKAVEGSLKPLVSASDTFVAVTPENPRAMKAEELSRIAEKYCDDVSSVSSVVDAVREASQNIEENDVLCVVGSLYLAGEVRGELLKIFSKEKF